jgi:hypothetical protein
LLITSLSLSDGKFDVVLPHVSECWINDILDKIDNITQIEEVREVSDTINTEPKPIVRYLLVMVSMMSLL